METMDGYQQKNLLNSQLVGGDEEQMCTTACNVENWHCPICMDLLFKPCVNSCGHTFCFWCMHHSMNPFRPSQCPLCRAAYTHFPRVCVPLHYFLASMFPEKYAERERENRELEAQQRVESPDIPFALPEGQPPLLLLPEVPPSASAPAAADAAVAATDGVVPAAILSSKAAAAPQADSDVQHDERRNGISASDARPVAHLHRCNSPSCGRLAFRPCVLSCGCMVCRSCVPGSAAPTVAEWPRLTGQETGLEPSQDRQPLCPSHTCAEDSSSLASRVPQCPSCGMRCTPDPRVCAKLEEALRCLYPDNYSKREEECSATVAAAAAASGRAAPGAVPAGTAAATVEGTAITGIRPQRAEGRSDGGADRSAGGSSTGTGTGGGSSSRGTRPPSKLPRIDALIAAATAAATSGDRGGDGGGGTTADSRPPSIDDIWMALREEMAAQADTCFTWYSVGCDDCGVFPITGRRYRCKECTELIGYDLCGACYDRGTASRGRFNQAHRPEHQMVKMEPCLGRSAAASRRRGGGGAEAPTSPEGAERDDAQAVQGGTADHGVQLVTLINCMEVLHPELSVEQATALVMMHLASGVTLDFLDGSTNGAGGGGGGGRSGGTARVDRNGPGRIGGADGSGHQNDRGSRGRWAHLLDSSENGGRNVTAAMGPRSGSESAPARNNNSNGGWSWTSWMSRRGNGGITQQQDAFTGSPDVDPSNSASRDGQEQPALLVTQSGSQLARPGLSQRAGASCCVQ
ncbi:hypothetical protein VaNZ11_012215 [Volvox africanus]|uniref:RING-type domain-containing protein n=1 Tax=Volvox africanus TaxID=51714 RepID=A0ABQ5SDD2_9CHLO|nr:hypothetical protein VaNZ11_012215 [Volvox africanus]